MGTMAIPLRRGKPDAIIERMHYVYILESYDGEHWYVGCTTDLERRLKEHNGGDGVHTKKYRPWKIKMYVVFHDQEKAFAFEKYLKSNSGRAFTKCHF